MTFDRTEGAHYVLSSPRRAIHHFAIPLRSGSLYIPKYAVANKKKRSVTFNDLAKAKLNSRAYVLWGENAATLF
jgi:hypothetical protein